MVANLQQYVIENTDCQMGNIEAEGILDFVIKEVTPFIYNQAIGDARKIIERQ